MAYKVFLSPSNQTDNKYACGHSTEAETCGKISEFCAAALERNGIQTKTVHLDAMAIKVAESNAWGADLHVPIHTNAAAAEVGGTRVYCSSYSYAEGFKAAKAIFDRLAPVTPGTSESIKEAPNLYEIRAPKAPTAYVEAEFHHVAEQAHWIETHSSAIGEAIAAGICDYFGVEYKEPITEQAPPIEAPEDDEDETGCGCTALESKVADLEKRVSTLEKQLKVYHTFLDLPTWAQPEIRKLIEAGVLFGTKEDGSLDLTQDLTRALVILARILYGDKEAG